ncbi:hypothetical protein BOTBODRAFT_57028 [Botryobasidium botryosum FD-172 SS1]|uniref:Uncharacterized protein n=1 Tax=Botryobasidium botryosum (strain FD-172 SS1) TaxID=930990 RepID=A0A067MBY9_BOTB1|nr:hypothetical protein BOTBODRAFT_57028 [Botryobasidium botryosum FD-172 SS1]
MRQLPTAVTDSRSPPGPLPTTMKSSVSSIWHPTPAPLAFGKGHEVPDATSNVLSQIFFTWLTPLLGVGWSRPLQRDDLWEMDPQRRATQVGDALETTFFQRCPLEKRPRKTSANASRKRDSYHSDSDSFDQVKGATSVDPEKGTDLTAGRGRHWRWSRQSQTAAPKQDESFLKALNETFFWLFWRAGLLKLCSDTLLTTSPLVTRALLTYLTKVYTHHSDPTTPAPPNVGHGIGLAIALYAMQEIASLCSNMYFFQAMTTGFLVRTSVVSCIFRKSLRLSGRSRIEHSTGQITTLISTDASRLDSAASQFHGIWTGLIQITLGMILLIINMGYSALVALAVLILATPIQAVIVRRMMDTRRGAVKITDKRVRLVQEVLQGIRLLVLFGWQGPYAERIVGLRKAEITRIKSMASYRGIMFSLVYFVPILAAILSFITYSLTKHSLEPAIVFSSLQYLNVIRNPMFMVPLISSAVGDAHVAIGRISKFLTAEEMEGDYPIDQGSDLAVQLDGDFTWEKTGPSTMTDSTGKPIVPTSKSSSPKDKKEPMKGEKDSEADSPPPFQFTDIHVTIPRGKFVAIVGKVGSGKSSLLQAMAGEMRKVWGEIVFGGSVAYVAQSPWIQNMTLRENVVFGQHDDEDRFREVIQACALQPDIDMLPDGEATEIGERGVNLSGGQKARVSLARAAYYNADVLLLDDPLSAVDPHVSKHIVDKCFLHGPMADKTRILVTHQLHVMPQTDYIYFLQDGRITEQGTYAELIAGGKDFAKLIEEFGNAEEAAEGLAIEETATGKAEKLDNATGAQGTKKGVALIQQEERAEGSLSWSVYSDYIRAAGSLSWAPLLLILLTVTQCFRVANSVVLGLWSAESIPGFSQRGYMILYATTGLGQAIFVYAGSVAFSYAGFYASLTLFGRALSAVLGSPMSFFDTTPIGRIMSRLTKDIDTLDFQLPDAAYQLFAQMSSVFGTIGLVIWSYPWLGLIFPPLIIVFSFIVAFYRRSSCEIQRLDALLRSLLYASYTEALTGLSTIRAYREQARFVKATEHNLDIGNRAYFLTIACQRWLTVRIDAMGNVLILAITLASIGFGKTTNPAILGVVLNYALAISQFLGQFVYQMAQVEKDVERVLYYGRLPQEGPATTPSDPPASWPAHGAIHFKDVQLAYRPGLPLVLKGVSFNVQPGEHVGVVGRTGAGKTSLLSALFRVVHPLAGGSVEIDGVDVARVGLETLRWRISVIPQDAVLFGGSLRSNLDPTGKATDQELYAALKRVGLVQSDSSSNQDEGGDDTNDNDKARRFDLDAEVRDDGFSAGEKQLIALCRALVKNSQIIVLDEATASVDVETDSQVQKMIQQDFKDKTLVCIAHRRAIGNQFYDRILVMDAGRVAEYDTPLALFDRPDSIFRDMCEKASLSRDDILRIRENAGVLRK